MSSMQCDSASESDASSVDGSVSAGMGMESLRRRIDSLLQEKRVLRMEVETLKLRVKALQQENLELRRNSVSIQAKAEQEEEYITNTMLKKIQNLQKEKERLAQSYEQEEEHLTNDLTRRLFRLKQEKVDLEMELEREQEAQVNKLLKRIEKLENDVCAKQASLDQLRQEKVSLENALEQEQVRRYVAAVCCLALTYLGVTAQCRLELKCFDINPERQESLVNRLWKRMEKLEAEKKSLQRRLEGSLAAAAVAAATSSGEGPETSRRSRQSSSTSDMQVECSLTDPEAMASHINQLKSDLENLRQQLDQSQAEHQLKMSKLEQEERCLVQENTRLKRRLQTESDKRDRLTRNLSESDAGSDMELPATEPQAQQHRCRECRQPITAGAAAAPQGAMAPPPPPPPPPPSSTNHPSTSS
uniref:Coiled-coil domain-containing protein 6 n=1 Tax=Macrostomum lignano TaxID=282301 RepID=A0A1I8HEL1_9PLAT